MRRPSVGRAVAGEPQLGTEVAVSEGTEGAAAAGNRRIEHNALPRARAARDNACELVAEDEWLAEERVTDAALDEPVAIRPAETDGTDSDEYLPRARLRVRLFVQSKVACRVQAQHLHVR